MEFGEMKRKTSNWSNFCMLCFCVTRVWQCQLGFLVCISQKWIGLHQTETKVINVSFYT